MTAADRVSDEAGGASVSAVGHTGSGGLTPDERVERVRMALAEAGHPDAVVSWSVLEQSPSIDMSSPRPIDEATTWRAHAVANPDGTSCWPCWSTDEGDTCTHDPLTSPWPERAAHPDAGGRTETGAQT